ncbi:MAG: quinolinate synthase NadA [Candidatus Taylorbacteria bacterium]|nr:quinolinate synthase NadA [Candidatus Taylorbacteria bacterium]
MQAGQKSIDEMSVQELAEYWYELFNRTALDLNLNTDYTRAGCTELAEIAIATRRHAYEKKLLLLAHYYMRPEIQKTCHFVGDSLGLGLKTQELIQNQSGQISAVWLSAVRFMGDTVKIILGDTIPVFMPKFSGCSLVASLHNVPFNYRQHSEQETSIKLLEKMQDEHPVDAWLKKNPDGIVLSYMNSDPESKRKSWSVFTSRNALKVLESAMRENPGKRVYMLPDQFLSNFVLEMARANNNPWIKPDLVDVFDGLCHVHAQKISPLALDEALARYPNAALAEHPECGCSVDCLIKVTKGLIPRPTFIGSTQEMIEYAKRPDTPDEIIVATEAGHVFTLRDQVPSKTFYPVTSMATCEFMKATKLLDLYNAVNNPDWSKYEVQLSSEIIRDARPAMDRMRANA